MSRKKTEINPVRAERVKKIIELEKISQKDFADRIFQTQQNVSRIVKQKTALTEETAHDIVSAFPKYRIEWLLGYDDYMTFSDQLTGVIRETNREAELLHTGFFSFAQLSGFKIDVAPITGTGSLEKTFQNMKEYCTISRDGKSVTLSMAELNSFENELSDYIELRLRYMLK